jgi:hypothetical protein
MEPVSRIRMVTAIKGMVKCGDQKMEQVTMVLALRMAPVMDQVQGMVAEQEPVQVVTKEAEESN